MGFWYFRSQLWGLLSIRWSRGALRLPPTSLPWPQESQVSACCFIDSSAAHQPTGTTDAHSGQVQVGSGGRWGMGSSPSALRRSDQMCHTQLCRLYTVQLQRHQSHRHDVKGVPQSCATSWPWMSL